MATSAGRLIPVLLILATGLPPAAQADDGSPQPPQGDRDGIFLHVPSLPPMFLPRQKSQAEPPVAQTPPPPDGIGRPDARSPGGDLYHEFGTVTPGGGRRGAAAPDPYGGNVVGPGGVTRPMPNANRRAEPTRPPPPTAAEKQAQIRKALTPKPPLAEVRRHTLDDLYAKLAAAGDEDEAKGLASLISAIWMRSGSDTADLLMGRADKAIAEKKYALAIQVLDRVVALKPSWPEGWNKRAAARYLAGDLDGAMSDVDHVLKLEPNHFAALNGLATILQRTGFNKRALQVYRRELAIYPHQSDVEKLVEKLTLEVEGQGI